MAKNTQDDKTARKSIILAAVTLEDALALLFGPDCVPLRVAQIPR